MIKYLKIPKLLRVFRCFQQMQRYRELYTLMLSFTVLVINLHFGACFWVLVLDPCKDYDYHAYGDHGATHDDTSAHSYAAHADDHSAAADHRARFASVDDDEFKFCSDDLVGRVYIEALQISTAMMLGVSDISVALDGEVRAALSQDVCAGSRNRGGTRLT